MGERMRVLRMGVEEGEATVEEGDGEEEEEGSEKGADVCAVAGAPSGTEMAEHVKCYEEVC